MRDVSAEFVVLRAPGVADSIGGQFALVPRAEVEDMKKTFGGVATQVGTWALDAERVAKGRPRIGFETDHKSIPNELGVLNTAVHMKKGCYRGQETVATKPTTTPSFSTLVPAAGKQTSLPSRCNITKRRGGLPKL